MTERGETYEAGWTDAGRRVDRVLRKMLPSTPLSALYRLLRTGAVRLNGARTAPHAQLKAGDKITLPSRLSPVPSFDPPPNLSAVRQLNPSNLPTIVDNEQVFVINKPAGVAISGPVNERPTPLNLSLEPFLAAQVPKSLSFHPVAVHRLDRICSGLLIYAKTIEAAQGLTAMLRERSATKVYLVLIEQVVKHPRLLKARLRYDSDRRRSVADRRAALSVAYLRPINTAAGTTLAAVSTRTGRRHQVRALCGEAGLPLAGARRYGSQRRQKPFLHAWLLLSSDRSFLHCIGARWLEAPPEITRLTQHSSHWNHSASLLRSRYLKLPEL